jgi:hypothetical protein
MGDIDKPPEAGEPAGAAFVIQERNEQSDNPNDDDWPWKKELFFECFQCVTIIVTVFVVIYIIYICTEPTEG